MKCSIKDLIKKINNTMYETPLPFDNKSANDYRIKGEEFRERMKSETERENENIKTIQVDPTHTLYKDIR